MNSKFTIAILLVLGLMAAPSSAATLDIQFGDLDLIYDGSNLFDSGGIAGGAGNYADADPITSISFTLGGNLLGTVPTGGADILITGLTGIPVAGGTVTSSGNGDSFGFDVLSDPLGFGLGLDIETVDVTIFFDQILLFASGTASSVRTQNLPFLLELNEGDPVTFSATANITSFTESGGFFTSLEASGTGQVIATGQVIPEPATLVIWSLLGLFSMGAYGWRRRSGAWRKGTTESIHEIIDGNRG